MAQLDILNLFDPKDHDIDYFYVSRLPGEPPDGVADVHFHPVESRPVRFYLTYTFGEVHGVLLPLWEEGEAGVGHHDGLTITA